MQRLSVIAAVLLAVFISVYAFSTDQNTSQQDSNILSYIANPEKQSLQFYWKNKQGKPYANFKRLKDGLEQNNQKLVFAMNGGMFNPEHAPQGLYIEKGETISSIDASPEGFGNFYLKPNGVFFLTKEKKAFISTTQNFVSQWLQRDDIEFATQSGPMLVIEGELHPAFQKGSNNLHIRNGVGLLPNGQLIFAISQKEINLHKFASFFKKHGCKNALYLDGFVSKAYLPTKNRTELDGNFAVIIAEINN